MTSAGCAIYLCLLVVFTLYSAFTATRHHQPIWLGLLTGLVAWLAVMSAWCCVLSIYDGSQKSKHPNRIGVSNWVIAAIWAVFLLTTTLSIILYRRIYAP